MKVKIINLFTILFLVINTLICQKIDRKYIDMEDIREVIGREVQAMKDHNDFFSATNIFYVLCLPKIQAAIDALSLDEDEGIYFCKMIENVIPDYFMNVFIISPSENGPIMNNLIKEFFKNFVGLHFDIENLKIASMFHKQIDLLWRTRHLFGPDEEFFENLFFDFVPEDGREQLIPNFQESIDHFINFLVYRLIVASEDYLYSDRKLYMYTLFKLFEKPFELVTYFLNDIEYMAGVFNIKYGERRLYLLDSIDNIALKSLNVFKEKETAEKIAEVKGTDENLLDPLHEDEEDDPLSYNPHIPHEPEVGYHDKTNHDEFRTYRVELAKGVTNFRMINQCIKGSSFHSQSLEKLYCYHIVRDTPADDYILTDKKYNEKLLRVFFENSKLHADKFVNLKATYFTEESIYDDKLYPEFVKIMDKAKLDFETEYAKLKHKFFEDSFNMVRTNMYYLWRRVTLFFLTKTVFKGGISAVTLFKNLNNFETFARDNWLNKDDTDYFKYEEFNDVFRTEFNANLEKFSRFT